MLIARKGSSCPLQCGAKICVIHPEHSLAEPLEFTWGIAKPSRNIARNVACGGRARTDVARKAYILIQRACCQVCRRTSPSEVLGKYTWMKTERRKHEKKISTSSCPQRAEDARCAHRRAASREESRARDPG